MFQFLRRPKGGKGASECRRPLTSSFKAERLGAFMEGKALYTSAKETAWKGFMS